MTLEELIKKKSKTGAKKICGIGQCISCYDCGHSNRLDSKFSFGKTDLECPLAKYNVKPDTRKWQEIPYGESYPTNEELFALCAGCSHGEIVSGDEEYTIDRDMDYCINCPVFSAEESMNEVAAEAAMS